MICDKFAVIDKGIHLFHFKKTTEKKQQPQHQGLILQPAESDNLNLNSVLNTSITTEYQKRRKDSNGSIEFLGNPIPP